MSLPKFLSTSSVVCSNFLRRAGVLAIAALIVIPLQSSIRYDAIRSLIEAVLLFGVLGGLLYSLILTTKIKLFVEKIGFFNIFLNAFLLYLLTKILPSFHIEHFSTAFWAGFFINILNWGISSLLFFAPAVIKKDFSGIKQARAKVIRTRSIIPSSQEHGKNEP